MKTIPIEIGCITCLPEQKLKRVLTFSKNCGRVGYMKHKNS